MTVIPASVVRGATTLGLVRNGATGLQSLTQVTNAGDGTNRLFLVERRGTVRVVQDGVAQVRLLPGHPLAWSRTPAVSRACSGLAFHPDFETNRRLFVYYTRIGRRHRRRALRGEHGGDRGLQDDTSRTSSSSSTAPNSNHNGGAMAFGPDGYLYIGTGDGGGAGDPDCATARARPRTCSARSCASTSTAAAPGPYDRYCIPPTNPFRGAISGLDEIWAYGLRNPWRISFDRGTGSLYIADVGQSRYEEINREPAGYKGGRNYGWNVMEGKHCFNASRLHAVRRLPARRRVQPLVGQLLDHRRLRLPRSGLARLVGQYIFADFCSGRIWSMPAAGVEPVDAQGHEPEHHLVRRGRERRALRRSRSTGGCSR